MNSVPADGSVCLSPNDTQETQETQETEGNSKPTESEGNPGARVFQKSKSEILEEFLLKSVNESVAENERMRRASNWHTPCFGFARRLKSHPDLGPLLATAVLKKIETIIRRWERSHNYEFCPGCFRMTRDAAHAEILDSWEQIRRLPGLDALKNALEFSRQVPLKIHDDVFEKRGRNETYRAFISLCGWLQVTVGDEPIAIPCREFGEMLGVDKMTISRFRKWAVADQYMTLADVHEFHGPTGKNKATTFRFRTDHWPCLSDSGA